MLVGVDVDWGSVPDWLAGVAAFLALVLAAIAARVAWKANQIQLQQLAKLEQADRTRTANDERSQAQCVAVWFRMMEDSVPAIVCFNGSTLPVYDLHIYGRIRGLANPDGDVCYMTKGPDPSPRVLGYATKVLIGSHVEGSDEQLDWSRMYRDGDLGVSIKFRDSAGRAWVRTEEGELTRLEDGQEIS